METDETIIGLFFARDERAIAELDLKYGRECHRIAQNILNNRADAEECVNDAYLGFWNSVPPASPSPVLTYLCRIVRNLALKRYHANTAAKRNSIYNVALDEVVDFLPSGDSVQGDYDAAQLARHIEAFLDGLSAENRVIFMRRYWFSDSYGEIAARVGLSEKTVSVRLVRLRRRMRGFLEEKGVIV